MVATKGIEPKNAASDALLTAAVPTEPRRQ